jgi:hypothetical protein
MSQNDLSKLGLEFGKFIKYAYGNNSPLDTYIPELTPAEINKYSEITSEIKKMANETQTEIKVAINQARESNIYKKEFENFEKMTAEFTTEFPKENTNVKPNKHANDNKSIGTQKEYECSADSDDFSFVDEDDLCELLGKREKMLNSKINKIQIFKKILKTSDDELKDIYIKDLGYDNIDNLKQELENLNKNDNIFKL